MKRICLTIFILSMGLMISCKESRDVPVRKGPGPNLGTTQPAPATATAPGMNPPHGQPNHRCDIPVGAPLNSSSGQQPMTVTPVKPDAPTQTTTTTTVPGMNPPHGQPNHRCDIPVGAPLNSPPPSPK